MNYKHLLGLIGVAGTGVITVYFLVNQPVTPVVDVMTDVTQDSMATSAPDTSMSETEVPVSATDTPAVTPVEIGVKTGSAPVSPQPVTATPPATQSAKTFTLAEVTAHHTEANCWTTIEGKVYDLTAFITKHPGGDRNILKICGIDGTKAFVGQHGGQKKPESTLEEFYLGDLR